MFRKLLVAYDGSEGAIRALVAGMELAKAFGVDLHAIAVEEDLPKYVGTMDEFEAVKEQKDTYFAQMSREAQAIARSEGVTLHTVVLPGHEVGTIVDYATQQEFDTLLVGYHGHSAISERIRGSTTGSLVLNAPCTVVVVK